MALREEGVLVNALGQDSQLPLVVFVHLAESQTHITFCIAFTNTTEYCPTITMLCGSRD